MTQNRSTNLNSLSVRSGREGEALAYLTCHNIKQKAKIFEIIPTKENTSRETVLYLDSCSKCGSPILEIHRSDIWGNAKEPVRLKTKNIEKFLVDMVIIWQPATTKEIEHRNNFGLGCNEYGVKKICYSNLSNMQIGKTEIDTKDKLNNCNYQKTIQQYRRYA